jgi:hypothetical protein
MRLRTPKIMTRYVLALLTSIFLVLLTVALALGHLWLNAVTGGMGTGVGVAFWGTATVTGIGAGACIFYLITLQERAALVDARIQVEAVNIAKANQAAALGASKSVERYVPKERHDPFENTSRAGWNTQ